jgi:hypothetical protein
MNYDGPLYAPWHKVLQGRPSLMTLDLKELQYLEQILIKTLPDKQSMVILQKVRNKIHKLSS